MFVVERQEFALFLFRSFLLGGGIAAAYLLLGFVRIPLKGSPSVMKWLFLPIVDLLFCCLAAFSTMLVIYVSNRGQVRLSALLFEVLGFCALYLPFEKPVEKIEQKVLLFAKNRIISPLCALIWKGLRTIYSRTRKAYLLFKLKRYNRNLNRLLTKRAETAIKRGEGLIFPEK